MPQPADSRHEADDVRISRPIATTPRPRRWLRWLGVAPSLVAGSAFGWCFAHLQLWPVQIVALAWLAHRLHPRTQAFWFGTADAALFGLAMYGAGLWWIPWALIREWPQQPIWPALTILAAVGLMRATVPLVMRGFLLGARRGWALILGQPISFAAAWTLLEIGCVSALHLPMLSLGYGQIDGPMAGIAPLLGVQGVSFCVALIAWLIAEMVRWAMVTRESWPASGYASATLAVIAFGMAMGFVQWTYSAPHLIQVAAMQDGLSRVTQYTQPGQMRALRTTERWAQQLPGALLVGSESQIPESMLGAAQAALAASGSTALIGVRLPSTHGWTNSVVAVGAQGAGYRYDKRMLIPFGEYTPSGWLGARIGHLLSYTGGDDLQRGASHQPAFDDHGVSVIPTICFENFFPSDAAARMSARQPRILANLADMAIFSGTPGMAQDVAVNRMLALSLQTPLARGSNDGTTMLIDSDGRVVLQAPQGVADVLAAEMSPSVGLTPYARLVLWMRRR